MALKDNLIKLMAEKKITIRELAEKTDISEPTLKRLRSSDDSNPTLEVLMKISTSLDITVNELIGDKQKVVTIYQDKEFHLAEDIKEFIFIFTKNTFSLLKGSKAVFKRYQTGDQITRYILNGKGVIFEKIDAQKSLFRDENLNNFSITPDSILAYIIKELYEVTYV
jgi:transcriptional regulator with XRE-family HTH domain